MGILVKLGADGLMLVPRADERLWVPAVVRNPVDVTGAGDTVVAAFTIGLAAGLSAQDATLLAGIAAGIVVKKAGTEVVWRAELATVLAQTPPMPTASGKPYASTASEMHDRLDKNRNEETGRASPADLLA